MKRQFKLVHYNIEAESESPPSSNSAFTSQWDDQPQTGTRHEVSSSASWTQGKGLLSSWKGDPRHHPLGLRHRQHERSNPPASIIEQDTIIQEAIRRPITGAIAHPDSHVTDGQLPLYNHVANPPSSALYTEEQAVWSNAAVGRSTSRLLGYQSQPPSQQLSELPIVPRQWYTKKGRAFPIWLRATVGVLLLLLIISGSGIWYYQANFAGSVGNITGQAAAQLQMHANDGNSNEVTTANGSTLSGGRINILLLGSDNDKKFDTPLAQTDIILTIDPQTKYVGMLSIPRDLWLNVPNFGMHKLDEAFYEGWANVHAGPTPLSNAVGLSIATIEQDFGIHIDHYAWVGLTGFIKVIDTANGVDIDATHPMADDVYPNDLSTDLYGYKRLYIAPGPQHLNGIQALEYVRTRHSDLVGDFGRSIRQQQILSQLKTKLANPEIVNKLPELVKDLNGYVKTDMQLSDVVNLVSFARGLDPNTIDRLVLSPPYSSPAISPIGGAIFTPRCSLILPKLAKMFALGNNAVCNTQVTSGTTLNSSKISSPYVSIPASFQAGQASALSLSQGTDDLFGVHSLLDLMFLIAFESLDGAKI